MITVSTDATGRRTFLLPQALADVAVDLFSGMDQTSAVFRLAKRLSWADCHTVERIALNSGHADAVEYARARIA